MIQPAVQNRISDARIARWLSLRLLDQDTSLRAEMGTYFHEDLPQQPDIALALTAAQQLLSENGITTESLKDRVVSSLDRKSTSLNSSHIQKSRMPSSA